MVKQEKDVLLTQQLTIGYKEGKLSKIICGEINIQLKHGELICLLGPNGSGKSTLIRTLAGIQNPLGGTIELCGNQLIKLTLPQIAKHLSLVLTERIDDPIISVYDLVTLGRTPYTNWTGKVSLLDRKKIEESIQVTGIEKYSNRKLGTLSDGEKQKVMIARALAQDTSLIILDEPTAHLDLPSRVEIMRLLRKLAHETGKSIILSTHELDLALQVADKIWLMHPNGVFQTGVPEDLIINGAFATAFKKKGIDFDSETGTFKISGPQPYTVTLWGSGHLAFWTKKALNREGIATTAADTTKIKIEIKEDNRTYSWITKIGEQHKVHTTLEQLIRTLKEEIEITGAN